MVYEYFVGILIGIFVTLLAVHKFGRPDWLRTTLLNAMFEGEEKDRGEFIENAELTLYLKYNDTIRKTQVYNPAIHSNEQIYSD